MKKKIFKRLIIIVIIFIIMVIIFISGNSKKLTQPELDKIYNMDKVHLDQITKYNDDTYGMAFTEKELCNKDWNVLNLQEKEYCSLHPKMKQFYIINIKTKQSCVSHNSMTIKGVSIYDDDSNCGPTMTYILNNTMADTILQLIKANKKYIDSYQK